MLATHNTNSHSQQASCLPLPALVSFSSPPPPSFSPLPHEADEPLAQLAYVRTCVHSHTQVNNLSVVLQQFFLKDRLTFSSLLPLVFSFSPPPLSSFSLSPSPPGVYAAWQPPPHDDVAHVPIHHTHANDITMTSSIKMFTHSNLFFLDLPQFFCLFFFNSLLLLSRLQLHKKLLCLLE